MRPGRNDRDLPPMLQALDDEEPEWRNAAELSRMSVERFAELRDGEREDELRQAQPKNPSVNGRDKEPFRSIPTEDTGDTQ